MARAFACAASTVASISVVFASSSRSSSEIRSMSPVSSGPVFVDADSAAATRASAMAAASFDAARDASRSLILATALTLILLALANATAVSSVCSEDPDIDAPGPPALALDAALDAASLPSRS